MKTGMAERAPVFGDVWREQFRVTGLSIRREVSLAALALGFFCVTGVLLSRVPALAARVGNELADFRLDPGAPGLPLMAVVAALLLPLVVWKGERPWGDTPLWSLPVDHRRHILTKVAAGWVWLITLLVAALVCIMVAVVVGGGTLGVDEVRQFITSEDAFFAGAADGFRVVEWTTPWWEWVLPFTSATAAYLIGSALLLGTPHPFRWAIAIYLVCLIPPLAVELFDLDSVERGIELVAWSLGGDDFVRGTRLADGSFVRGWIVLPSVRMWATSTVLWNGLGLVCLFAAVGRVRDH